MRETPLRSVVLYEVKSLDLGNYGKLPSFATNNREASHNTNICIFFGFKVFAEVLSMSMISNHVSCFKICTNIFSFFISLSVTIIAAHYLDLEMVCICSGTNLISARNNQTTYLPERSLRPSLTSLELHWVTS